MDNYLVNALKDKAITLQKGGKKVNRENIANFARILHDYVTNTGLQLYTLPEITSLLKDNYGEIKDQCFNDLINDYFPGAIDLLFGLSQFNEGLEKQIFNEFDKAVENCFSIICGNGKKLETASSDNYKLALKNCALKVNAQISKSLLDSLIKNGTEADLLPGNINNLTGFIFETIDYLNHTNDKTLLKKYCLQLFNYPSKKITKIKHEETRETHLLKHMFLLAFYYLNKLDVSLPEDERQKLNDKLYEINKNIPLIGELNSKYLGRKDPFYVEVLSYLIKNRLLDYTTLEEMLSKDMGNDSLEDVSDIYRNILISYPGLIKNPEKLKDLIESFINPPETLSDFIEYDPIFTKDFTKEAPSNELVILLQEEFFKLNKDLKHFKSRFDILTHLTHILYLSDPIKKSHKELKDRAKKYYDSFLKETRVTYDVYFSLIRDLSDWSLRTKDGIGLVDAAYSLLCLRDLVDNESLRVDIVKQLDQLNELLKQLDIKGVFKWQSNLKRKPANSPLDSNEKELLIKDLGNWYEQIKVIAKSNVMNS